MHCAKYYAIVLKCTGISKVRNFEKTDYFSSGLKMSTSEEKYRKLAAEYAKVVTKETVLTLDLSFFIDTLMIQIEYVGFI